MIKTAFKYLTTVTLLIVLAACGGGQPDLSETQAVAQSSAPDVRINSDAQIAWRASSSGSKLGAVQFEPVVEGNTVFVVSRKGHIEGFDLDTGERKFTKGIGGRVANGVGVNAGSVVAVTEKGEAIAFARDDASELWRTDVGRSISSAPAMNDQVVAIRTVDGQMIGLNAATGKQLWLIERPVASLSVGLDAPGLVFGEGLVSGFSSGRVLASNIFNGTLFWEKRAFRPTGRNEIERLIDIDASPVQAGQFIVVGSYQGGVVAYQLRDGVEAWRNESAATRKPMAVSNSMMAVTGPESEVAVLGIDDGKTLWKKTQLRGNGLSSPVITDQSVVVGTMDSELYFLDLDDGKVNSRYSIGSGAITSLLKVKQGVLVYSAGSGRLTLVKGGF